MQGVWSGETCSVDGITHISFVLWTLATLLVLFGAIRFTGSCAVVSYLL